LQKFGTIDSHSRLMHISVVVSRGPIHCFWFRALFSYESIITH